jgi:hypothetical protein
LRYGLIFYLGKLLFQKENGPVRQRITRIWNYEKKGNERRKQRKRLIKVDEPICVRSAITIGCMLSGWSVASQKVAHQITGIWMCIVCAQPAGDSPGIQF